MKSVFALGVLFCLSLSAQDGGHETSGNRTGYRTSRGSVVFLPRLLTSGFNKSAEVCADAQKHKRDFAIVSLKTHACDCEACGSNYCLEHTRNVSDPANSFILMNFAAYHTRPVRHPELDQLGTKKLDLGESRVIPGAGEPIGEWNEVVRKFTGRPNGEPGLLVMDTKQCAPVGFVPMEKISTDKDREKRAAATNDLLREALKKIKPETAEIRKILDFPHPGLDANLAKIRPELTLPEYVKLLDAQLAKEDAKGEDFLKNIKDAPSLADLSKPPPTPAPLPLPPEMEAMLKASKRGEKRTTETTLDLFLTDAKFAEGTKANAPEAHRVLAGHSEGLRTALREGTVYDFLRDKMTAEEQRTVHGFIFPRYAANDFPWGRPKPRGPGTGH